MKKKAVYLMIPAAVLLASFFAKETTVIRYKNYYVRCAVKGRCGISAYYYNNTEWKGTPALIRIEDNIGFRDIRGLAVKDTYASIKWYGLLNAPETGRYRFKLYSDDGSELYIDGRAVLKNGGIHPAKKAVTNVYLRKGVHPVEIRYFQAEGKAVMSLFWRPPPGARGLEGPIPASCIIPAGTAFSPGYALKVKRQINIYSLISNISALILALYIVPLLCPPLCAAAGRLITKYIPYELRYITLLFAATRICLTIIGTVSRRMTECFGIYQAGWVYSKKLWLDIWGVWDTTWYLSIADNGYPHDLATRYHMAHYGFFPLYPFLIRLVKIIAGSTYISGIVVSNICLFAACIFLYKLALMYTDKPAALRAVKYMFLFPSAFILSGVFSEPLFLLLAILSFYYAKKERWLFASTAGCLAAFTRSNGVFILLPVLYMYLRSKGFRIRNIRPDILWLGLIPLALLGFAAFCHIRTGNAEAYVYAKKVRFYMSPGNPFKALYLCLKSNSCPLRFNAIFSIAYITILLIFAGKLPFSHLIYSALFIFVPLIYGVGRIWDIRPVVGSMTGMMRFAVVVFPFYILSGRLSQKRNIDTFLTVSMSLLQGFLMVFWSAGTEILV